MSTTEECLEACKGVFDPVNAIQNARERMDDILCQLESPRYGWSEEMQRAITMLQAARDDLGSSKEND